jgi:hypothetical protein
MLTTEELNIAIEELLVKARSVFDKYDGAFAAIGAQKDGAVSELNTLHTQLMDDLQALANGVGLEHEWDGTSVRFKQNDGAWGSWVNLQAPSSFDYEAKGIPTETINPISADAKWLDLRTAEIFVCTDNTTDKNAWVGSNGTIIGTIKPPEAGQAGFPNGVAPSFLVEMYGLSPLEGFTDPTHENYGNYKDASGSIMVYRPKRYVKKSHDVNEPYFGTRIDVSDTQQVGYSLPRCFINNGVEIPGVFVDKFHLGKEGAVGVSKRNLDPVSTNTAHNPISALTANSQAPANRYDGMYAAVKTRGDDYSLESIFLFTFMADMADAHYQACFRAGDFSSCAWADVAPYQPKGCNNDALADNDDASVTYTGSGYSNCGLTGGVPDAVFAKICDNGQKCGVADLNGNMWEVVAGYITDASGNYFVLKESVDIKSLTASAAYDTANYDAITIPLTLDNTQVAFGNGTNQFFSGSTDRNSDAYKLDNIGLPMADTAVSSAGTARYGQDGFWRYQTASMCPIAGGNWARAALSGVRARSLYNTRTSSGTVVGGRACLIPSVAG